eukprot:TRINITY_DN23450_c0_g1_i1.p1 TRINITY_DN23450_c0_g1~~TRINITY_DN23450_c0_g1_i1.p1  ORF type:complete len:303 (-),score=26.95 TRINITY_DN23450_c0_g1_i1:354-1181(-)
MCIRDSNEFCVERKTKFQVYEEQKKAVCGKHYFHARCAFGYPCIEGMFECPKCIQSAPTLTTITTAATERSNSPLKQKNSTEDLKPATKNGPTTILSEQDLVPYEAKCLKCNNSYSWKVQKGNPPPFWKCSKCTSLNCTRHEGPLEECLCLCPNCTDPLKRDIDRHVSLCKKCKIMKCEKCQKMVPAGLKFCTCTCQICYNQKDRNEKNFSCGPCKKYCHVCLNIYDTATLLLRLNCTHKICVACIRDDILDKRRRKLCASGSERPECFLCAQYN